MNEIILASASPRRKELLAQIGIPFRVCVSDCEEIITETLPDRVVCELSRQKARNVWQKLKKEQVSATGGSGGLSAEEADSNQAADEVKRLVIGADTVVVYDGRILGKPADVEQAVEMLTLLAGNTHQVYTGVTFCYQENGTERLHTFYEMTEVTVYPMSKAEITAYVETGEPMDKAGAYGIQGRFAAYVKEIHGDYNNVVGLPVGRLYQELKDCR
ncbi:MAG: septum formation protein Maf [Lachnospiraceae bacterium]|nr:septum formation protein Maf [Lachnospiraceae bacterium]